MKRESAESPSPDQNDSRESQERELDLEEAILLKLSERLSLDSRIRVHYYVKVGVSAFLAALLIVVGVPVFIIGRYTGSLSYTALGVVLTVFGLILAVAVIVLLFNPPFKTKPLK